MPIGATVAKNFEFLPFSFSSSEASPVARIFNWEWEVHDLYWCTDLSEVFCHICYTVSKSVAVLGFWLVAGYNVPPSHKNLVFLEKTNIVNNFFYCAKIFRI